MPLTGSRTVADDESMETDPRGLAHSRHQNNASPPQGRPDDESRAKRDRETAELLRRHKDNVRKMLEMVRELQGGLDDERSAGVLASIMLALATKNNALNEALIEEAADDGPIMIPFNPKDLNKVIFRGGGAQREEPTKRSWANIAANGSRSTGEQSTASASATQAKIIPTRHMRQLTVRAPGMTEDLKTRDNKAIVTAVNNASPTRRQAVAVTRLQSGDQVITFEEGAREWYAENTSWVKKAFGETAELVGQTYTVMAKYLPIEYIRRTEADRAATEMSQQNSVKISQVRTIKRFMKQDDTRTHVLIEVTRLEAAQKLCRNGLVWEAQIFNCEPYTPELRPMQCYRCWGWGHMAKHCKATARCGRCSATAHEGGEEQCPSNNGQIPKSCPACKGGHTAFDRHCPVAKKQWDTAKANYISRPKTFMTAGNPMEARFAFGTATATTATRSIEEWTTVSNKRRRADSDKPARGRPREVTRAGRTNGSTLDIWADRQPAATESPANQAQDTMDQTGDSIVVAGEPVVIEDSQATTNPWS